METLSTQPYRPPGPHQVPSLVTLFLHPGPVLGALEMTFIQTNKESLLPSKQSISPFLGELRLSLQWYTSSASLRWGAAEWSLALASEGHPSFPSR